jgi:hypothetical protein
MPTARGTFEVKMTREPPFDDVEGVALNRTALEKTFSGDLTATSRGQMIAAMTAVPGSAGYVAIERVSGVLGGRRGTFVLQHSGMMTRGRPSLVVSVVPDSATGELQGLSGTMAIQVADGQHTYVFEYGV